MKTIISLIIICLFQPLSLAVEPNLVWEKTIYSYDILSPSSRNIYNFNSSILIHYSGFGRTGPGLLTSSFYEINLQGDTLNHVSISIPSFNFLLDMMNKNESYYFLFKYYVPEKLMYEPIIYKYDSQLKNFEVYTDTLYPFSLAFPIEFEDSIIFVGFEREKEYYSIKIFDKQLNYFDEIILDTNGINIPHSWRTDPGFENWNGNFTFIFTSNNYDININEITDYGIIVQFDRKGKVHWSRKVASTERDSTLIEDLFEDKNGNIVATGITRTGTENQMFIINKYSYNGDILFEKTQPMHKGMVIWSSGNLKYSNGYYVCGTMEVDSGSFYAYRFWLRLLDENGEITNEWDWSVIGGCVISDIIEKENGNLLVYGRTGGSNLYLAEINPNPISIKRIGTTNNHNLLIYPNPLSEEKELKIRINLETYSLVDIDLISCLGNKILKIYNGKVEVGEQTLRFTLPKDISKGIYWIRMYATNNQIIKPIIVE